MTRCDHLRSSRLASSLQQSGSSQRRLNVLHPQTAISDATSATTLMMSANRLGLPSNGAERRNRMLPATKSAIAMGTPGWASWHRFPLRSNVGPSGGSRCPALHSRSPYPSSSGSWWPRRPAGVCHFATKWGQAFARTPGSTKRSDDPGSVERRDAHRH